MRYPKQVFEPQGTVNNALNVSHFCKAQREKIERIMGCKHKFSWWICTFSSFFIPRVLVLWARFARRGCAPAGWVSYHLVENNPLRCLKIDLYTHIISSNNSCSYDNHIALNNSDNDILVNNFNQTKWKQKPFYLLIIHYMLFQNEMLWIYFYKLLHTIYLISFLINIIKIGNNVLNLYKMFSLTKKQTSLKSDAELWLTMITLTSHLCTNWQWS